MKFWVENKLVGQKFSQFRPTFLTDKRYHTVEFPPTSISIPPLLATNIASYTRCRNAPIRAPSRLGGGFEFPSCSSMVRSAVMNENTVIPTRIHTIANKRPVRRDIIISKWRLIRKENSYSKQRASRRLIEIFNLKKWIFFSAFIFILKLLELSQLIYTIIILLLYYYLCYNLLPYAGKMIHLQVRE